MTRSCCSQLAAALRDMRARRMLLAYHDRSDGGLLVTLLEMAFAGHCGLDIALPAARGAALAQLFTEEPGVVLQVSPAMQPAFSEILARHELAACGTLPGRAGDATCACRCASGAVQPR